ncbi:MAG: hypothetical protein K8T91_15595, partial [Planctomycetes bacterium]|nr:hypothetical protein [Planctomycetota bacterium]
MRLPLRSWKDTLSSLGLKWGRKPQRRKRRSAQLSVEPLEARQLLAAYTWSGATGGSWGDITKWSGGAVPGINDTATISGLNAGASITLDGGRQIGGLTIASNNSQTNVIAQGTGSGGLRVGTGGITTSGNQS